MGGIIVLTFRGPLSSNSGVSFHLKDISHCHGRRQELTRLDTLSNSQALTIRVTGGHILSPDGLFGGLDGGEDAV